MFKKFSTAICCAILLFNCFNPSTNAAEGDVVNSPTGETEVYMTMAMEGGKPTLVQRTRTVKYCISTPVVLTARAEPIPRESGTPEEAEPSSESSGSEEHCEEVEEECSDDC